MVTLFGRPRSKEEILSLDLIAKVSGDTTVMWFLLAKKNRCDLIGISLCLTLIKYDFYPRTVLTFVLFLE